MKRPTLDTFTRAYVTAALWLLDENPPSGELERSFDRHV